MLRALVKSPAFVAICIALFLIVWLSRAPGESYNNVKLSTRPPRLSTPPSPFRDLQAVGGKPTPICQARYGAMFKPNTVYYDARLKMCARRLGNGGVSVLGPMGPA